MRAFLVLVAFLLGLASPVRAGMRRFPAQTFLNCIG
jgi:hypothetical protein